MRLTACTASSKWAGDSVNPISPIGLREQGSPPATVQTRRAGCAETRLSGSTEACWCNPFDGSDGLAKRVIPAFYPMRFALKWGDADIPSGRAHCPSKKAVLIEAGAREDFGRPKSSRKSAQGVRDYGAKALSSFNLRWRGERPSWRQADSGSGTVPAFGEKKPTAKSSTMRGAKALASEIHVRRCRTANGHDRRVRGSFLLLPPEIVLRLGKRRRKLHWDGSSTARSLAPGDNTL